MPRIPQHRQLSELLKDHILSGRYAPGDMLPSENALCQVHSLTRPTVRQALGNLVTEGLIKRHKGKGSIVQSERSGIGILNLAGTTDSLATRQLRTAVCEPVTVTAWPVDFPFELAGAERDSGCVRFGRLRLLEGKPIIFERTFLPNVNLPRFTQRSLDNQSLFRTLARHYDISVEGGRQQIWALPAGPAMAGRLRVPEGTPLVRLYKTYETNRPDYRFFTMLWCDTADHSLVGDL